MSLLKEIFDKIFSNLTLKDIRGSSVKAGVRKIQKGNPGFFLSSFFSFLFFKNQVDFLTNQIQLLLMPMIVKNWPQLYIKKYRVPNKIYLLKCYFYSL